MNTIASRGIARTQKSFNKKLKELVDAVDYNRIMPVDFFEKAT